MIVSCLSAVLAICDVYHLRLLLVLSSIGFIFVYLFIHSIIDLWLVNTSLYKEVRNNADVAYLCWRYTWNTRQINYITETGNGKVGTLIVRALR